MSNHERVLQMMWPSGLILLGSTGGFSTVAQDLGLLCVVAVVGLVLGSGKFRGVGLGVAGVLFSGLFFGHLGWRISPEVGAFLREMGLILFVYTIGVQVGPGFFSSLRQRGLVLNGLAVAVVLLGGLLAAGFYFLPGFNPGVVTGLFSGATTNTPSLGAAQEALRVAQTGGNFTPPALAYAISYPFGVVGIILSIILLRSLTGRQIAAAEQDFLAEQEKENPPLASVTLEITNPNVQDCRLEELPGMKHSGVVVSRIRRDGQVRVARAEDRLRVGDRILAVGPAAGLESLRIVAGRVVQEDLRAAQTDVTTRRVVVTRKQAVGRTLESLGLGAKYGVTFTRLSRAEVELPAPTRLRLHAGDTVTAVGNAEDLDLVAAELGNSMSDLNLPRVIPIFIGILLGVVLGSLPLALPGIPAPVRLGLAGGPLLVAILLSYAGRIGPLLWYLPPNANFLLRELGIVLFLAVVGLNSGGQFVETVLSGDGWRWLLAGAAITLVPLIVVGLFALLVLRLNYLTLTGLLAGSTTDPPALAYANSLTRTAAPALAYSTVYPLTMLLRVVVVQLIVLFST